VAGAVAPGVAVVRASVALGTVLLGAGLRRTSGGGARGAGVFGGDGKEGFDGVVVEDGEEDAGS
jgi:hypothetical protein